MKRTQSRRTSAARQKIVASAAALWLMGTPALTACSDADDDTQNVYCVDQDGNIIDPKYCDDDNGYYYGGYPTYLWITSTSHAVGYHIPRNQRSSGSYFRSNNATARQNAGLSGSGRPSATVRRSGGFGSSGGSNPGRSSSNSGGSHGFGGHSSGG